MNMKCFFGAALLALTLPLSLCAQNSGKLFTESCDSMSVLMKERSGVTCGFKVLRHFESGKKLNIRFSTELGDYPWRKDEVEWFRKTFGTILPAKYTGYSVGNITVNGNPLEDYIVTVPGNDGSPAPAAFRRKDPKDDGIFIRRVGEQEYAMGLTGRTVALWQSHGRY